MEIHWDQLTKPQWQAHLGHQTYGLRQDWDFGLAMGQLGANVGHALVCDGGKAVAVAQVLQRRGLRVLGQGPVWLAPLDPGQKRRVIRRLACHAGASIVTPTDPLSGWGLVPVITPQSSANWAIAKPSDALRKGLQGKWRNRLLRAEEGVKPNPLGKRQLRTLIEHEATTRRARGYANLPGGLAEIWAGESLAMGWHAGGALQAGMVFLIHDQSASYFLGWASDDARKVFAHGPILWQATLALRDRGVRFLDLGGVNTQAGGSLARFKLGTGAGVVTAGATCLVLPAL